VAPNVGVGERSDSSFSMSFNASAIRAVLRNGVATIAAIDSLELQRWGDRTPSAVAN